jgi:enoyl-CoA hydratase
MLRQLMGPQGLAAVVLCGESLDGEAAVRTGLAWKCFDDDNLLEEAERFAKRAAVAPREMVSRLKASCRAMGVVSGHDEAVDLELEAQLWSVGQTAFRDRLAALKRRIAQKKP